MKTTITVTSGDVAEAILDYLVKKKVILEDGSKYLVRLKADTYYPGSTIDYWFEIDKANGSAHT